MLQTYTLLLVDDQNRLSTASLNSLLQRLSGNEFVGSIVVVTAAKSLTFEGGLSHSVPLRVVVAQTPEWSPAEPFDHCPPLQDLQQDRVIQLTAGELEGLADDALRARISDLVTEVQAGSESSGADAEVPPLKWFAERLKWKPLEVFGLVPPDRTGEVWITPPGSSFPSRIWQGNDRNSVLLRNAFVGVCLIVIGTATLGLFLPSKSVAVAANDGKVIPTPIETEIPAASSQLVSNPSSAPANKPAVAPVQKPPKPPVPPIPASSIKTIDWPRVKLDLAPEAIDRRLRDSAAYLASDELEGRGVRTQGLDLAADYLASEFKAAGLKTDLVHGQPFQEFELYAIGRERVVQDLQVRIGDDRHELVLDNDFSSLMAAASSTPFNLELVFVGYGLTLPDGKYDDYAGLDVEGKAVIVLRNLPPHLAKNPSFSQQAFLRTKVNNAVERRAAAIIFCSDAASLRAGSQDGEPLVDSLLRIDLATDQIDPLIPIVHCHRAALAKAAEDSGFDLDGAEAQITKTSTPQSRVLGKTLLYGRCSQARVGRKLKNVLASIAGEGEKAEQTIVVGAHYDHLGRGGYGSLSFSGEREIHNGADDNASGTAVLLEVARQLRARNKPLARRVLFAGFSGEELGLVGSKRYVKEPIVPLGKTVAMLNLDMVGRLREGKLTVYGSETSPSWPKLLDEVQAGKVFSMSRRAGGFGPSDHASFYEKGIPVLHFFTGFHPQYHRPGDDAELLNIEGMRQITDLVVELVVALADPEMQPAHRAQTESLLTDASPGFLDDIMVGKPGRRPSLLGVVLAPAGSGPGLIIERTLPNSIAQKSGLRVGDLVREVDGKSIKTSDEMAAIVRGKKLNDELKLLIERNGVKLEVKVKF